MSKEPYETKLCVTGMRNHIPENKDILIINCTSRSSEKIWTQLSPFYLGPVQIEGTSHVSKTHENAWQYAKVYTRHLDEEGNPSEKYWIWAKTGWNNPRAVRYPAGKGAIPEYSFWNNTKYGYVEARKRIYAPTYAALVTETDAYKRLEEIVASGRYKEIWFRDFDGYDYTSLGYSLQDVINDEKRKMGHAFVLVMCLLDQKVWE